ncbi:MAG: HAMP domain-containing histidine kinase [Cyclobacteriaceae bacterium]|nr:HAMP domain-containing histidine kinase [Cyclobacteriaceae bacterium]
MGLKRKILLYFSLTTIVVMGIAWIFIYSLFSQYREEEFQQRQKDKIISTLRFLSEIREADNELVEALDRLTINDLYNEKLLIFDKHKKLIYSSIDDTPIPFSAQLLNTLSGENPWVETKEGLYDIVGIYFEQDASIYYGISKAYDTFGYTKLNYLRYILMATFIGISVSIVLVSYFLAQRITQPLLFITRKINRYNFDSAYEPIEIKPSGDEITQLAQQFNKLMKRMHEVFAFQKHAIHHISHELKTPIAILVSNFERMEKETDEKTLRKMLLHQKEDTMSLSDVINSLLEIAKAESGNIQFQSRIRMDELIFDCAKEVNKLYADFTFAVAYANTDNETNPEVTGNERLLKAAVMNLMLNCIQYSNDKKANISILNRGAMLEVNFENSGQPIGEHEQQFLFQHFFRGENSKGKRGFGLGLVFAHKILTLHRGSITYQFTEPETNWFKIILPLS